MFSTVLVLLALTAFAAAASLDASPVLDADMIAAINSDPTSTWTAGHNEKFAGMTVGEAKRLLGAKLGRPAGSPEPIKLHAADIPDSFDARKQWPNCIGEIRDQGQCGSCWAFGATEAFADRICVAGGNKVVLSPQNLVSCDTSDYGCEGGYLQNAWNFMTQPGVVSDDCYPYTSGQSGDNGQCSSSCTGSGSWQTYQVKSGTVQTFTDEKSIQTAVMTNGPIEVSFSVYQDFMSYSGGVYQHKSGQLLGGHAVKVVGWDKTDDGTPYWIIANSWNTSWGIDGFFWMLRGQDECGIEDNGVAGLAQ